MNVKWVKLRLLDYKLREMSVGGNFNSNSGKDLDRSLWPNVN